VVVELKSPGADLDAKQSGYGNLTPVEQAFGYLAKFDDCRWVIVSNFTTVCLYSKRRGQVYAHAFDVADLAKPESLRLFLFLLGRERLIAPPPQASAVDLLLEDSCTREQAITRDFYSLFTAVRSDLFGALCRDNPPPADAAISLALPNLQLPSFASCKHPPASIPNRPDVVFDPLQINDGV
jgi:hypothetical protein